MTEFEDDDGNQLSPMLHALSFIELVLDLIFFIYMFICVDSLYLKFEEEKRSIISPLSAKEGLYVVSQ